MDTIGIYFVSLMARNNDCAGYCEENAENTVAYELIWMGNENAVNEVFRVDAILV